jgi:hypothetical protein
VEIQELLEFPAAVSAFVVDGDLLQFVLILDNMLSQRNTYLVFIV